jgi:hypothetical protein
MKYRWHLNKVDGTSEGGIEEELYRAYSGIKGCPWEKIIDGYIVQVDGVTGLPQGRPVVTFHNHLNKVEGTPKGCPHCDSANVRQTIDSHLGVLLHCECGIITAFKHRPTGIDTKALAMWQRRDNLPEDDELWINFEEE